MALSPRRHRDWIYRETRNALARGEELTQEPLPSGPVPTAFTGKLVHMGRARRGPAAEFTRCGTKAIQSQRVAIVYPNEQSDGCVNCRSCLAVMAPKAS